jgi:hypothetical protein
MWQGAYPPGTYVGKLGNRVLKNTVLGLLDVFICPNDLGESWTQTTLKAVAPLT